MTDTAETSMPARRPNRRGQATRENMLEAALNALASGDPASVSANRIAKDIGATWGAVQYQFGDADGFWAAVLHRTAQRRADVFASFGAEPVLSNRVANIIDTLFDGLDSPDSRAIENLRAALPRDHAELERLYPRTAAELYSWGQSWLEICRNAFEDLGADPERVREVATLIPGAMRGLVSERQLGSYSDLDLARRGLTNALVAYLEAEG
ncbi:MULTISPECIES: TetR/AcrR family transcriptional regulator [Mycobacteriaceae]|uniref:TetR family transcriptional regulator n=1 Tax=Mycolicibacterium neoaurum VKM Ac-1815D TaxID=700508 RepID=V5XH33_MYCNE|nr:MULTISPECIES: TetR/AcrR family transcriptional regulator [Mycobacteriaceae]AHC27113.1 TetR family transcriptional regulator [Mycolicibacterium neoaurum VKM Ac-1815D]AMO07377.1 TetR family transcriptional regulator [Mycolicibacterium neoaurum]AXK74239.1 TetR/AcrR family transcriptional regulator [Mycolicibacterium neoaurum]KJQ51332.1 TetR family transcriptional regulator [Mycolicibacterium neoaurum]KUM09356.1 TetR family transcriptional regulator [Mycolicibacterium neoaurum]